MEKKLYKSKQNKILAGVCGGVGEYFGVDPVLIRLLAIVFCLMGGAGIIAYIIAAIIIPAEPDGTDYVYENGQPYQSHDTTGEKRTNKAALVIFGIILICFGGFVLLRNFLPYLPMDIIFAGLMIVCGVYFIAKKV